MHLWIKLGTAVLFLGLSHVLVLLTRRFGISRECSPLQATSSLVEATWLEVQSKALLCPTSFSGFVLIGLLRNNLSVGQSCISL